MDLDLDFRMELNDEEKAKLLTFAAYADLKKSVAVPPRQEIEDFLEKMPGIVQFRFRDDYIHRFGFVLPCAELIQGIAELNTKIVSVGAGTGYLEKLLQNAGVDVIATDLHPPERGNNHHFGCITYTDIIGMGAVAAVKKYPERAVLMSWPTCMGRWAYEAAKEMQQGQLLIYIGERQGCTACEKFDDYLNEGFTEEKTIYTPIHDVCWVYRKL